jgi:hypothetical protein
MMKSLVLVLLFTGASFALPQGNSDQQQQPQNNNDVEFSGPKFNFRCPEPKGKFRDPEQCDLYYVCEDSEFTAELCDDGLLFDDSKANQETCKLPYDVDCGDRVYVQEPLADLDPRCKRGNGFFDHLDPNICNKFYSCDKGTAFEMPCSAPLMFDIKLGTCTREEQLSNEAKRCRDIETEPTVIDGFTCPGGPEEFINGQTQGQHPLYPHPSDCQYFFTCFFNKDPNKLGCPTGQVFDAVSRVCKTPESVPECGCWYDCGENSKCPDSCNADCTCGSNVPNNDE